MNAIKILYVFLGGFGVFLIPNLWILTPFFLFNVILYFAVPSDQKKSLKFLDKVKWFVIIIFVFASLSKGSEFTLFQVSNWKIGVSKQGILDGGLMVMKVLTMLFITQTVRQSMSSSQFTTGLSKLGLGKSIAANLNEIMRIVLDQKKEKGKNKKKNKNKENKGETSSLEIVTKGKIGNIPEKIKSKVESAREQLDSTSDGVAESALAITLIRMVKIAPGLPLAPGHKNVLIFPVFIYGIKKSSQKWSGLKIGMTSGIIHFFMGFGKYGPLGIFQFALIGLFFDFGLKLFLKRLGLFQLLILGIVGGILRFSTEFLLAWMLGLPKAFIFLYLPYIIAQMSFGAGSAFVSLKLLDNKNE